MREYIGMTHTAYMRDIHRMTHTAYMRDIHRMTHTVLVRGASSDQPVFLSVARVYEDTNNNCYQSDSHSGKFHNGISFIIDHKLPFPSLDVAGVTLFRYKPCLEPVPAL